MNANKSLVFRLLLLLLLATSLLAACAAPTPGAAPPEEPASPTPATDLDAVAQTLDDMRETWRGHDITDYQFEFQWRCFCPPAYTEPVRIIVKDGAIASIEPADAQSDVEPAGESEFRTIAGLFDLIRDAIKEEAHEIEVSYNDEYGFPVSASLDYDALIADEERGFEVSNFEVIEVTESTPTQETTGKEAIQSDQERITSPDVPAGDLNELAEGNTAFAFDLYHAFRQQKDNLFYSPYSISMALAMTYAGARGETAEQMVNALNFTLPENRLHPAFNALDLELATRGKGPVVERGDAFQLNIVNQLWGQAGYTFLQDFLDTLAAHYGAGMRLLDFQNAPEPARQTINNWVAEQTEDKIEDLIPPGAIDEMTRLVLTNAIYFNATWQHTFNADNTQNGPFYLLDGSDVTVPLMHQTEYFNYTEGNGYQAVELPYAGQELSMVILLPEREQFEAFESELDAERVDAIVQNLGRKNVKLTLPKFEFNSDFQLSGTLAGLGMPNAFDPQAADFSGMDGTDDLFIQDVVHKAFVSVDEEGTEAAAATGVMMGATSAPPPPVEVTVDHPFIFMIRDIETEAILFVGRVLSPAS